MDTLAASFKHIDRCQSCVLLIKLLTLIQVAAVVCYCVVLFLLVSSFLPAGDPADVYCLFLLSLFFLNFPRPRLSLSYPPVMYVPIVIT